MSSVAGPNQSTFAPIFCRIPLRIRPLKIPPIKKKTVTDSKRLTRDNYSRVFQYVISEEQNAVGRQL